MKLLFLYGPPAAGKLTVAEKLSALAAIPLFHNHLSRDLVEDIYGDNLTQHYELVDRIRTDVLEYCASHDTNLIFTYVYEGKSDDDDIRRHTNAVHKYGGEVVFVEIMADREDLIKRVSNESRKRFKKLTDPTILAKITEDMSSYSIPYVDSIKVNTSRMSADEAANMIAARLNLSSNRAH